MSSRAVTAALSSPPSLALAEKFRQSAFPRRVIDDKAALGFRRAEVGEHVDPTTGKEPELYPLSLTSTDVFADLDSFGLGISLYFRQVLAFFIVLCVCSVVLSASLSHNADTCDHDAVKNQYSNAGWVLGSAAGCYPQDLSVGYNIVPDIIVCLLIILGTGFANYTLTAMSERIDDSQQTPCDYSICVRNPPEHVTEPDKYRDFFSSQFNDNIVTVTVSKDNGNITSLLAQRRVYKLDLADFNELEMRGCTHFDPHKELGFVARHAQPLTYHYGLNMTRDFAEDQLEKCEARLRHLLTEKDPKWAKPSKVYVTFNTEEAQQRCLQTYSVPTLMRLWSNITGFDVENVPRDFDGTVLDIFEPTEPSEIFWHNSHVEGKERLFRLFISLTITIAALCVLCTVAIYLSDGWAFSLSVLITMTNSGLPVFLKLLTDAVEKHKEFGDRQESMFMKLVIARWVNTAISIFISFVPRERLSRPALSQIMVILLADAFATPLLQYLNLYDRFMRRYVSPKAPSQRVMNVHFRGTEWNLAERYTNVSKTVFVGFFFSAALPSGLFVTAAAMIVTFLVDRYSLLRQWRRVPNLDDQLAKRTIAIVALIVFAHFWASLSFFMNWGEYFRDALKDGPEYLDDYPDEEKTKYVANCFYGLLECDIDSNKEITDAQRVALRLYRALGFCALALALWKTVGYGLLKKSYYILFDEHFDNDGTIPTPFRSCSGRAAYVPIAVNDSLADPLIAAVIEGVPRKLLPTDLNKPLEPVLLANVKEIIQLLPEGTTEAQAQEVVVDLFGVVKFYPPNTTPPLPHDDSVHNGDPPPAYHRTPLKPPGEHRSYSPMPLPPGWEAAVGILGRPYYLDHNNKKTSWNAPAAP